jgi:hypothetical protein
VDVSLGQGYDFALAAMTTSFSSEPDMRFFALVILFTLAAGALPTRAHAFPHIDPVASDTISTIPLRVRTTFNLDLVGPGGYCWIDFYARPVGPGPADSTHFFDCSAPSGWTCFRDGDHIYFSNFPNCFGAGDHFTGFSIVTNRPKPCALIIFGDPVLLDGGSAGVACLDVDGPVPTKPTTWGSLKSRYR